MGRRIAHGSTSEVFEGVDGTVVKLLRNHVPSAWAEREAKITEAVHGAGLPAPAVLGLVMVDERPGIVFERIAGETMWDRMVDHPEETAQLAETLSELQSEINSTPSPYGLPHIVDRLAANILQAAVLTDDERQTAMDRVGNLPKGSAVCHFDIHPKNVLLAPDGPIAVDWFDAGSGDPAADVVRSSLLMRPDMLSGHLDRSSPELVETLHASYLRDVVGRRQVDPESILGWETVIAASRLAEPLTDDEIAVTLDTWRTAEGDGRSDLEIYLEAASI
ncbi:MAG: phosphotransferase family protein [Acidimicrobiia bacterium]